MPNSECQIIKSKVPIKREQKRSRRLEKAKSSKMEAEKSETRTETQTQAQVQAQPQVQARELKVQNAPNAEGIKEAGRSESAQSTIQVQTGAVVK